MGKNLLLLAAALSAAYPAFAATTVNWSTITGSALNSNGTTTATATMDVSGTTVDVTYTSLMSFVETGTGGGFNYWGEYGAHAPYTGGQYNAGSGYVPGEALADAPGDPSLVALSTHTTMTITFSQAVSDVYMGLVSWNNDGIANFSSPYSIVSSGGGYWGEGSFGSVSGTGFQGVGELHGVIEFAGPITTLTFDVTGDENWHGLLVGTAALAPPSAVPEPATWAMFIGGFGLVGAAMRRRQRATVRYA